jgi:hypothetical protein
MARKITTGRVGRAVLGSLSSDDSALKALRTDANISLEPNGTGIAVITSDLELRSAKSLRLADTDSSNYLALKAPGTVASNITYTLPGTLTNNYFLKTDAGGVLSWAEAAVTVTNQTSDTATYYPLMTTSTTGTLTAVNTSSTRATFQPSTGTFTSTLIRANGGTGSSSTTTGTLVVTGGVGVSGQLTATTIVETSSIVFKENINPLIGALESVLKLTGVSYDRTDIDVHEVGLIAEDVNKILPDLVSKDENGVPYGIKYTKLTAYLIESIKSLKAEIDRLKGF